MLKKSTLLTCFFVSVASTVLAIDIAPTLKIGGWARFQGFGFKNSSSTTSLDTQTKTTNSNPITGKGRGYAFAQTGEIAFKVSGKLDDGLEYGYVIALDGDSGQNISGFKPSVNENHIMFADYWGLIEIGATDGAQDFFSVGPMNVMGATGGIGGDYRKVFTSSAEVYNGTLMKGDTDYATKLSYYSPRIAGFKFGISFTPSTDEKGSQLGDSSTSAGKVRSTQNIALGLNYAKAWNKFGFNASFTSITGKTKRGPDSYTTAIGNKMRRVNSWTTGILLTYDRWMLGTSYIDNGTSMLPASYAREGGNAGKAYNAALGYNFGSSKVALGYQKTITRIKVGTPTAKANVISLTGDYTIAPGLGVYAEADYIKMRTNTTAQNRNVVTHGSKNKGNNKGGVFITGVKISF